MSNKTRAITVRVEESMYREYRRACDVAKRSMSKQGELLIEGWVVKTDGATEDMWGELHEIMKQIREDLAHGEAS